LNDIYDPKSDKVLHDVQFEMTGDDGAYSAQVLLTFRLQERTFIDTDLHSETLFPFFLFSFFSGPRTRFVSDTLHHDLFSTC
jgi:hypothetical protein